MLKRYAFIMLLLMTAGLATTLQAKQVGDFNGDGKIDLQDVIAFMLHLAGRKTVPEIGQELQSGTPVYYLYTDIYGNAEFESDNDYPPPDNLDNSSDDLIVVSLHFAEDFLGGAANGGFDKNDIYGYCITEDTMGDTPNFYFPFVPSGSYWASAELTVSDTCYFVKTDKFYHSGDTANTRIDLRPQRLGVDQGCFDLILSAAREKPVEYVQTGLRCWINKKVYAALFKPVPEGKAKAFELRMAPQLSTRGR
ncbi:hypothetical protein LLH00_00665 [bacterium]|nr:hypothetical protein [bacterium]